MALGGGNFTAQNKILPGSYINFISLKKATSALSDRGIAAMGFELDWGPDGEIFEISKNDFNRNCIKILGYDNGNEKLKGIGDLFLNIKTLYAYRLNSGGVKASCAYATAKYAGLRGNDLKIVVQSDLDDVTKFVVTTYLETEKKDSQTVTSAAELMENDFVAFKIDSTLAATVGTPLTGGTNGTTTGSSHQEFLDLVEPYSFNAIGVVTTEQTTKSLYANFTRRQRDEVGAKFQCVLYGYKADYEGVVNVKNKATDGNEAALVYWATGIVAGTDVNKSATNKSYNGEFTIDANYTQTQLEECILGGEFVLHKVGDELRVLSDINSLVTTTDDKDASFKENQTIRVLDQIGNDIAAMFNTKYLGGVANTDSGRTALWTDIVKYLEELQNISAIENFADSDVSVAQGDGKKSVEVSASITTVNAMAKLYMTVIVG